MRGAIVRLVLLRLVSVRLSSVRHASVALVACWALLLGGTAQALQPADVRLLTQGESDERVQALARIVAAMLQNDDAAATRLLGAIRDARVQVSASTQRSVIKVNDNADSAFIDAATGAEVTLLPDDLEDMLVNNRLRRELDTAFGLLGLTSSDHAERLAAVKALQAESDVSRLPFIQRALDKESDNQIRDLLLGVRARLAVRSPDKALRMEALRGLALSRDPAIKTLLLSLLEKKDGTWVEDDPDVRAAAQTSLDQVERNLAWGERIGQLFTGISLGSILLLAALGLAITYGLMGVINMAHGELIMVGAYATYVVQNLFRSHLSEWFNWYPVLALPAAFAAAALVGMALERSVIRFLYGRPLETLLATWGISLMLVQSVRSLFGAQNVQVENPVWLSGGLQLLPNLVLPWNRLAIIVFAAAVLLLVWLLLTRTRLGLFVRGVTQNRAMANCAGVNTARIDTWAFGLGSGIAGLAGCALSQIGNVGPDLGQGYIVDSFMVVVLGGVGQLAGTVYAALGLGVVNKLLEAWSGAVLAKIAVLVFIIIFIQKRPQGLFALKGRFADA
jgi:urea transport system permease protein